MAKKNNKINNETGFESRSLRQKIFATNFSHSLQRMAYGPKATAKRFTPVA
jgi:hypothetical protein